MKLEGQLVQVLALGHVGGPEAAASESQATQHLLTWILQPRPSSTKLLNHAVYIYERTKRKTNKQTNIQTNKPTKEQTINNQHSTINKEQTKNNKRPASLQPTNKQTNKQTKQNKTKQNKTKQTNKQTILQN